MFAIDLSGAHYGFYNLVVPWDEYIETRTNGSANFSPFGTSKGKATNSIVAMMYCDFLAVIEWLDETISNTYPEHI